MKFVYRQARQLGEATDDPAQGSDVLSYRDNKNEKFKLVYFRDRLEEKKAERIIFDGVVELLIELGLVKRAGKQRIDSTHILGYVKEMSRLECAVETVRLALEEMAGVVVRQRPEFWERLWALYMQSEVGWRLSKAERDSRYRQCGQDMKDLIEWIDNNEPKLREMGSIKLLRRLFEEQFELVEGAVQSRRTRPSRAVQNPHDPDAHYADKGTKQWIGYKVHVVESVDPEQPAKVKAELRQILEDLRLADRIRIDKA
jgi:hypothetical protein